MCTGWVFDNSCLLGDCWGQSIWKFKTYYKKWKADKIQNVWIEHNIHHASVLNMLTLSVILIEGKRHCGHRSWLIKCKRCIAGHQWKRNKFIKSDNLFFFAFFVLLHFNSTCFLNPNIDKSLNCKTVLIKNRLEEFDYRSTYHEHHTVSTFNCCFYGESFGEQSKFYLCCDLHSNSYVPSTCVYITASVKCLLCKLKGTQF